MEEPGVRRTSVSAPFSRIRAKQGACTFRSSARVFRNVGRVSNDRLGRSIWDRLRARVDAWGVGLFQTPASEPMNNRLPDGILYITASSYGSCRKLFRGPSNEEKSKWRQFKPVEFVAENHQGRSVRDSRSQVFMLRLILLFRRAPRVSTRQ